ncbi:MAG: alpha/beta hydrolase [Candidatus Nanopelagicales bacterium]
MVLSIYRSSFRGTAAVAASLALLALAGCSFLPGGADKSASPTASASEASPTTSEAALSAFYEQAVRWSGCGGKFECTQVKVPLSYAEPEGDTIALAVVRLPATKPIGSLLVNPGGPGGSGVEYARAARAALSAEVIKHYDIVGVDPRGVAESEPVHCLTDAQLDRLLATDGTPDTQAEIDALVAVSAKVGAGCKRKSAQIAANMGTEFAARDLDIVRAVVGDDKLNLLGKSYGTFLGAQYAELFPAKVGKMVLDGVLPSSLDSDALTLGQAKGFDLALRRFIGDCLPRQDCPLDSSTVDGGVAEIQKLLAELNNNPLPGIGKRELNEALATYAIASFLYAPPTDWEALRFGLAAAFEGDGSVLLDMADERVQRNADGTFANNGNEAFYAVSCLDRPANGGAEHAAQLAQEWAAQAPVFGPSMAWGNLPCYQWPLGTESNAARQVFTAKGSGPILVVTTKYDPATPYEWGVQVAKELENATLLTYDGDGHTAYFAGSTCVDNVVDAYLLEGTMPTAGVVCKPDPTDASEE